jgi:hypothetical protein
MDCRACHVNPDGGGMRNEHGQQFALQTLPFLWESQEKKEAHGEHTGHDMANMDGMDENTEEEQNGMAISSSFSLGADLRFVYLHAQSESSSAYKDSFFPMQMDIYMLFHPTPRLSLFYQDGISGNRETFGLMRFAGENAHLKFGKFLPPFGLKLDDHTSFIRDKLGFGNTFGKESDVGVALGFSKNIWFGNMAVFNGTGVAPDSSLSKAISATGGIKTPRAWLAGSLYSNRQESSVREYVGIYTAYRIKRVALLAEWDYTATSIVAVPITNGSVAFAEASILLRQGIAAKIKYDDYDPDRKASGDRIKRYTFGFDLYPAQYTEVLLQYRMNKEEIDRRNDQILVMTHLYF